MTRDETKKIIMAMAAAYPNYHPMDPRQTVDTWAAMLADYDYNQMVDALQRYILSDRSGFAPSIGQLVGILAEKDNQFMEPLAAWALVFKAIGRSGYGSVEEFEKLPPEIQEAVGSAANLYEMSQMDTGTVNSVEQSHFISAYRAVINRRKVDIALPPKLRLYGGQKQEAIEG